MEKEWKSGEAIWHMKQAECNALDVAAMNKLNEIIDVATLRQRVAGLEKERDELLAALKEAIDAVRVFHGPVDWETYRDHSPEMKRWQAAIASVKEKQNAVD